jgi:hypothetical protein
MSGSSRDRAMGATAAAAGTRSRAFEFLTALSFANLLYLRTWDGILDSQGHIVPAAYLVAIANVVFIAALLWGGYTVVQWSGKRWVRGCSVLALAALVLIPVHAVANIYFSELVSKRNWVYAAGLVAAAAIVASRRVRVAGSYLLGLLVPVVAITFGQSLWRAATYDEARWSRPVPRLVDDARTPRLVWIIFDEWDYGLSFDPRPDWLRTPELDRLNAVSFHASQAVAPGSETSISMPRLLTGDMSAKGNVYWNVPTIFSRAKAQGLSAAVSAWYIDYCRLFTDSLDACWSTQADAERNSMGARPAQIATNQLKYLFETTYRSPFGQSFGTRRHILDYGLVLRWGVPAAANPAFDLVFLHFPIPHPPLFYDHTTGRYDLGDKPLVGITRQNAARYLDAIELVDQTVGHVRRALDAAGVSERTHLIISSDHPARNRERIRPGGPDGRVPFIVRIAGTANELAYDAPFNTLVSSDLAMALLRGEIQTYAQVRALIEARVITTAGSSVKAGP